MNKKIASKIILASFIVCICLHSVLWFFLAPHVDLKNYENRNLATRPELSYENYRTFAGEYEAYFNDHLSFRNNLIMLNTAIDYFVFSKSSNDNVVIGEDNWLFYDAADDGDPIGSYQGINLFTEEELELIARNCINARDYLAENGTEFVLFIAPNKERIFSEYLPERYGEAAEMYRALQVVNYLRENTDIRVVYPYEELIEAKNTLDENIWYKTDTHWNYIGGYVGACALLNELGIDMPSIYSDEITISAGEDTAGDLAGMLNLTEPLTGVDVEYQVTGYNDHNVQNLEWNFDTVLRYQAEGADERSIYVYRDSFATHMADYIASQFNNSYFRHLGGFSWEDYEEQDPDIFVYEAVERNIANLFFFTVQ